jgi:hypothetical protein
MPDKKLKRMLYIYEENLEFYNSLSNKSQFVNDALQDARISERIKDAPEPQAAPERTAGQAVVVDGVTYANGAQEETGIGLGEVIPEGHPANPDQTKDLDPYAGVSFENTDPRIVESKAKLAEMDALNRAKSQ